MQTQEFEIRFRHIYMVLGTAFVLVLWLITDPDVGLITNLPFGASTIATLVILFKTILYVGVLHLSRKALLDYLDLEQLFAKAVETSEGAGKATIAVALIMIAIAITMFVATSR